MALTAGAPLTAAFAQSRVLFDASQAFPVDQVLTPDSGGSARILVVGPSAELVDVSSGGRGVAPLLPPPGVTARFLGARGGNRIARADVRVAGVAKGMRLSVFEGDGIATTLDLAGTPGFRISAAGETLVAYEWGPPAAGGAVVEVFDGAGQPRPLPWTGALAPGEVWDVEVSADGARVAVRRPGSTQVFDCAVGASRDPLYTLETLDAPWFDARMALAAVIEEGGARIFGDGVPLARIVTPQRPTEVRFLGPRSAVVLELGAVSWADLDTGALIARHAAGAGAQYRSVHAVPPRPGTPGRIVVGARRRAGAQWEGWTETFEPSVGDLSLVRATQPVPFRDAAAGSPQVRLLADGRCLAWSRDRVWLTEAGR